MDARLNFNIARIRRDIRVLATEMRRKSMPTKTALRPHRKLRAWVTKMGRIEWRPEQLAVPSTAHPRHRQEMSFNAEFAVSCCAAYNDEDERV